jgi:hypothetical protein
MHAISSLNVVASTRQTSSSSVRRGRRSLRLNFISARDSIASDKIQTNSSLVAIRKNNASSKRSSQKMIVRANKDDGFEVPDFVKDLMKPPDSSVAAPGWLAPLLGLAKESGESAVGIGYALMIVTSVFFSLVFAVIGLPGALCALIFVGASGYTCWQATPYLNDIVKEVESGFYGDGDDE